MSSYEQSGRKPFKAPRWQLREIQLNEHYGGSPSGAAAARAPIVFLVHDGRGEMLHYRSLANLLGPEVAVFGLYPMAAAGIAMAQTRIEDIAAAYVKRIRMVQPEGPYLLGGLCAGGVIAHAMACQLQRAGERIGMLALIDAGDVAVRKSIRRALELQLKQFSDELLRVPPTSITSGWPVRILGLLMRKIEGRLVGARARFKTSVLRYTMDRGRKPPVFVRDLSVAEIYDSAAAHHTAGVFHGDVLLFRALTSNGDPGDEPFISIYADPLLGWEKNVRGKVVCIDVPGGHYSLLEAANVGVIAERLREELVADVRRPPSGFSINKSS